MERGSCASYACLCEVLVDLEGKLVVAMSMEEDMDRCGGADERWEDVEEGVEARVGSKGGGDAREECGGVVASCATWVKVCTVVAVRTHSEGGSCVAGCTHTWGRKLRSTLQTTSE
ncbi:hypothetical protein GUJ93_ZPchr0009g1691 [Zizania palustris]|uniref:Uncharacterized protein n=1 Tax=Zizania palustris TaxID=103762 RepID=A0A8J5VIL9_ZIZPA|nr:hypothetical protein GUJ93_ZPchr0009g1691 [Zizania palustris]